MSISHVKDCDRTSARRRAASAAILFCRPEPDRTIAEPKITQIIFFFENLNKISLSRQNFSYSVGVSETNTFFFFGLRVGWGNMNLFIFSQILTEYFRIEPRVSVCLSVCLFVCVSVCVCNLYRPNR